MYLVDTCGWIEWLTDGKLSGSFARYLQHLDKLIVPSIIQFELYKWAAREQGEETALEVIGLTEQAHVVALDTKLALSAADVARQHGLVMADAIIYVTSQVSKAQLITCDSHFQQLADVKYIAKK